MAKEYTSALRTFIAGGAIVKYGRVKLDADANEVAAAGVGASDAWIGVAQDDAAEGEYVTVRLKNDVGTFKMIAGEAIAVNTAVYGAAAGKVADTASGNAIGVSLEASTADGDIIEVLLNGTETP